MGQRVHGGYVSSDAGGAKYADGDKSESGADGNGQGEAKERPREQFRGREFHSGQGDVVHGDYQAVLW